VIFADRRRLSQYSEFCKPANRFVQISFEIQTNGVVQCFAAVGLRAWRLTGGAALEAPMKEMIWFIPWQVVHFFGYCLIFGSVSAVVLRVLGFWKSVSFAAVHRLLMLGFVGVLMNVFSGMLMMLADSYRYVVNDYTFAPKMALLTIGATAALYFSLSDRIWKLGPGEDAPAAAKWVAVVVVLAWAGVIVCGRLLNYL